MTIHQLSEGEDLQQYDQWVKHHLQGNLWQSLERKKYIETIGKEVRIYVGKEKNEIVASALVMIDRTSFGLSTWEIPRGPLWTESPITNHQSPNLFDTIVNDAKKDKALALYLSPQLSLSTLDAQLSTSPSGRLQHCEATRIIDLTQSEEEMLLQMKQKGRYNIKVAQKHGVIIEESQDIDAFYALVTETASRDRFTHLSKKKYEAFLHHLDGSFLLLAKTPQNEVIAGLLGVVWGDRGTYYYGASSHAHRASMAPYLMQWEAMKFCKSRGCSEYDLLGVAPPDAPASHPWQGITSFKEKFGGKLVQYPPEQEVLLRPMVNTLLNLKRKIFK